MATEQINQSDLRTDYGSKVEWVDVGALKPHSRNASIYGAGEDIEELKNRIRESNWIKPLVATLDLRLVSGHRRWKAARELGISRVPVEFREFEGEEKELEALLLENVTRDKSPEQKVREAGCWKEIEAEKGRQRMSEAKILQVQGSENLRTLEKGRTVDAVAAKVGFGSGRTYEKAAKVVALADDYKAKGEEKKSEAILDSLNNKSVDAAFRLVNEVGPIREAAVEKMVKKEAKTIQHAIVQAKQAAIDEQAQAEPSKPLFTVANWREWLDAQPMCDLLLTDPPYSTDVEDVAAFAAEWLPVALGKVKPTGRAYVCIGAYPEEQMAYLQASRGGMELAQLLIWTYRNTLGPTPALDYKSAHQVILYFRGPKAPALDCPLMMEQLSVLDINAPDGRQGDRYHEWQKPNELAERFIRHSTKPGDLVLDPFAGTGTFLLAANRLGRIGAGCDINEPTARIAENRGCKIETRLRTELQGCATSL